MMSQVRNTCQKHPIRHKLSKQIAYSGESGGTSETSDVNLICCHQPNTEILAINNSATKKLKVSKKNCVLKK